MPDCINDINKKCTGRENTPLGLGYSSSGEEIGTIMKGKDDNLYIVKNTKKGKRWNKIDNKNIEIDII
jgi:hypothetical protein